MAGQRYRESCSHGRWRVGGHCGRIATPGLTMRLSQASWLVIVLVALAGVAACNDSGTAGLDPRDDATRPGGIVGGPANQHDASLVGYWSRRLVTLDNSGNVSESATEWQFEPEGTGFRLQISRNYTAFLADTAVTFIEWSTSGGNVTIDYLPPASGSVTFRYRVLLDTLSLDELRFVRE